MAVPSLSYDSDKENAPPPPAARGIAVKRQTMKKRKGGARKKPLRRLPLRDITRIFVNADPCPPPSTAAVLLALSDAAAPPEAVRPGAGASGAVTVNLKQGSHSPRMCFR